MRKHYLSVTALLLASSASAQMAFTTGPVIQLSATARPTDVAVADFNSDGRPDFAVTANGVDSLFIFKQQFNGAFPTRPDSRFFYPNGPISVVALPLIYGAVGTPAPPADALAVFTGSNVYFLDNFHNAQGTLTPRQTSQFYLSGYTSPLRKARLFAARMDGDRYVDLAAFIDTSPYVIGGMTLPGNGNAPLVVQAAMTTLPNAIPALSLASFTRTDRLDAIVPDPVLNKIYVVPNGAGPNVVGRWWSNFGIQDFPSGGIRPVSATAADVDGDGTPDLAAAHEISQNVVITLMNQVAPIQITLSLPAAPQQVELTDLNSDGRPDVVVLTTNGIVWLYRNTGLPGPAAIDPQPINLIAGINPAFLRIADVNKDNKPDLLVPAIGNNTVSIFYNQSTPLSATAVHLPQLQVYPNPAKTDINLRYQGGTIRSAMLLDAVGRSIKQWEMPGGALPVADIPRGLYILRMTTDTGTVNKRIVLE